MVIKELHPTTIYRSLCQFMAPDGIIELGSEFTGREWINLLVYEINPTNLDKMFVEV